MMCHVLIHPRVSIISSSRSLAEQETNDKQNNVGQEDTEFPAKTSAQSLINFGSGIDVEETIYPSDDFTLSTSKSNVNGQSTSNNSLNKDNTVTLSKEIQHGTVELDDETGQQNEEITKKGVLVEHEIPEQTITENKNNIKRRLPEEFKESTNEITEGLSEIVSDDIPPEKRHKIQDASGTEEGVLNNNDKIRESTKILDGEMLESNEVFSTRVCSKDITLGGLYIQGESNFFAGSEY